ncbi:MULTISPECIES: phage minor tail protein L [Morganellaceae]|uniref:Phage minor tail protein L n=1 Tax=Providencia vermicola TaxID=333965 RepID=A0AAX3RTH9_9GAMM|nr:MULTISPECIES: phage minor tail protein L [Morganellaceae]ELX8380916.1 phage minor tail protein L [Providencia stuartii]EMD5260454.1 phage minor tail protein L [Providencia stuartii]MDC6033412.1 phage minor tail protein L [Proteus mirabilis]MDC6045368.1 phage minor tail protein L [Proteus mirabilis]MDC6054509.1 phage minor tail protein L [Proteus mirabilis]
MNITSDIQKLESGNKVQLIEVDGSEFDGPVLRFHAYNLPHTPEEIDQSKGDIKPKPIWWQGNEYGAWPYEIEGMAKNSDGSPPRPTLRVANIDGLISSLCLQFDDMALAKVTIYETFAHYLDAKNFTDGNPTANPDECFTQVYYIDRKTSEVAGEAVEFELSTPFDLQGIMIPVRQIHNLCYWCMKGDYRSGNGCSYSGNKYFNERGEPVDDPSLDKCGGLISDCKKRFGENEPLDFGGFPAAGLIR